MKNSYDQTESAVLMSEALEEFENNSNGESISPIPTNLKFADNIGLISNLVEKLTRMGALVSGASKKSGMTINEKKTETMLSCKEKQDNKLNIALNGSRLNNKEC